MFRFIRLLLKIFSKGGISLLLLERKTPNSILRLEALLRRLDPDDKDYVYFQDALSKLQFGYEGEQRVDREWIEMSYLEDHYLLFNYEVENEFGLTHQIDTLLLTRNFLLLLEVKNIVGRVDYDERKHQFVRKKNGMEEILTNPFDQLKRHEELLIRLIAKMKYTLPIEKAVVMANPTTMIGDTPNSFPIFHASGLRSFVKKCLMKHPVQISKYQLEKLARFLMSQLKPRNVELNIHKDRIRKGVLCEKCQYKVAMNYKSGAWTCPKCNHRSKSAIYPALDDYRLLISNKITNREFRKFFNVSSMDAASKILTRLGFESVGKFRGRYYIIPEDIIDRGR